MYAPGMRVVIRDEEWVVKKAETNMLGNQTLYVQGISKLVNGRESVFLTDLETIEGIRSDREQLPYIPGHRQQIHRRSMRGSRVISLREILSYSPRSTTN